MMKYRIYKYVEFLREQEETDNGPVPYVPDSDAQKEAEDDKRTRLQELNQQMRDYLSVKGRLENAFNMATKDPGYDLEKELTSIHGNKRNTDERNPLVTALEQVLRIKLKITNVERKVAKDVDTKTELETKLRDMKSLTPEDKIVQDTQKETIDKLTKEVSKLGTEINMGRNISALKSDLKNAEDTMKEVFDREKELLDSMGSNP